MTRRMTSVSHRSAVLIQDCLESRIPQQAVNRRQTSERTHEADLSSPAAKELRCVKVDVDAAIPDGSVAMSRNGEFQKSIPRCCAPSFRLEPNWTAGRVERSSAS